MKIRSKEQYVPELGEINNLSILTGLYYIKTGEKLYKLYSSCMGSIFWYCNQYLQCSVMDYMHLVTLGVRTDAADQLIARKECVPLQFSHKKKCL